MTVSTNFWVREMGLPAQSLPDPPDPGRRGLFDDADELLGRIEDVLGEGKASE